MSDDTTEANARFRAAMAKLSKELTDKGMLVEAGWIGLRAMVFPNDTPTRQLDEHKATFFAGAFHLFTSIMSTDGILEPGGEPTEADERRMNAISAELMRFGTEFQRKYPRSKMP